MILPHMIESYQWSTGGRAPRFFSPKHRTLLRKVEEQRSRIQDLGVQVDRDDDRLEHLGGTRVDIEDYVYRGGIPSADLLTKLSFEDLERAHEQFDVVENFLDRTHALVKVGIEDAEQERAEQERAAQRAAEDRLRESKVVELCKRLSHWSAGLHDPALVGQWLSDCVEALYTTYEGVSYKPSSPRISDRKKALRAHPGLGDAYRLLEDQARDGRFVRMLLEPLVADVADGLKQIQRPGQGLSRNPRFRPARLAPGSDSPFQAARRSWITHQVEDRALVRLSGTDDLNELLRSGSSSSFEFGQFRSLFSFFIEEHLNPAPNLWLLPMVLTPMLEEDVVDLVSVVGLDDEALETLVRLASDSPNKPLASYREMAADLSL